MNQYIFDEKFDLCYKLCATIRDKIVWYEKFYPDLVAKRIFLDREKFSCIKFLNDSSVLHEDKPFLFCGAELIITYEEDFLEIQFVDEKIEKDQSRCWIGEN